MGFNILTAVIVDTSKRASERDRDRIVWQAKQDESEFKRKMLSFLVDADTDGTAKISWNELEQQLEDPDVVSYMTSLGVPRSTVNTVFLLLLEDADDEVPIDAFVNALVFYHSQGSAKHVDVATLLIESEL